jgi:succinyl-CoA synthetase beta subunit
MITMAGLIEYEKAQAMLARAGIKTVESSYVSSAEASIKFAGGGPIVLKAISQKALHKSHSGLVRLNLWTPEQVRSAYADLAKTAEKFKPYRILAQKMIHGSVEVIIGGKTDAQFGKMLLLGLGGVYVETFKDVALRACPIQKYDAQSMLSQLKSKPIIAPDKASEELIVSLLLKVSKMFESSKATELDLNPIILHDGTYHAVDLRIIE